MPLRHLDSRRIHLDHLLGPPKHGPKGNIRSIRFEHASLAVGVVAAPGAAEVRGGGIVQELQPQAKALAAGRCREGVGLQKVVMSCFWEWDRRNSVVALLCSLSSWEYVYVLASSFLVSCLKPTSSPKPLEGERQTGESTASWRHCFDFGQGSPMFKQLPWLSRAAGTSPQSPTAQPWKPGALGADKHDFQLQTSFWWNPTKLGLISLIQAEYNDMRPEEWYTGSTCSHFLIQLAKKPLRPKPP